MAYLTQSDIRGISCFQKDTLIAMKAPVGSTLEVFDPDDVILILLIKGGAIWKDTQTIQDSPEQ
jgi:hypothetical protein